MLASWWQLCWETISRENPLIFAFIGWEILVFPFFLFLGILNAIFGWDL